MTDFLIVHEAGQGAWFWNRVWGCMTAPAEHPPCLATPRNASQVYLLNLPGHGSDEAGDTGEVRLEECIQAITRTVERRDLQDLVLVGHGVGGMLALQAAPLLAVPPKRLALIAGIVPPVAPAIRRNALALYPRAVRRHFSSRLHLSKLWGRDIRLPRSIITRYMCNGMEPREITRALGFFGPLPTRVMEAKVALDCANVPCPASYVVLDRDRMLPPDLQIGMARRIPEIAITHLDSCHQAALHKPAELAGILLRLA